MTPECRAVLVDGVRELGLALDDAQVDKLLALLDELEVANAQFNLTAIRAPLDMVRKHLLDSLTVQPYLVGPLIADIGTGAGFPGLPLAIVNPAFKFTLVESVGKKARFVAATAAKLGLTNVVVVQARAEQHPPRNRCHTVIARALSGLPEFVLHAGGWCASDGRMLAMKGRLPTDEMAALPAGWRVAAVHRLHVPGLDDERHLVEICRTA
jgi:16S rRNA (guanine527-N7)-methyltransferase